MLPDCDPDPDDSDDDKNILVFGGPGAGKSALLGAIYEAATRQGALHPFAVSFTPDTQSNLLTNLISLREFCDSDPQHRVPFPKPKANAPNTYPRYSMQLSLPGRDPVELTFIDTAGADLERAIGEASLSEQMQQSAAAILVVDAVELLHQPALANAAGPSANRNMPANVDAVVHEWVSADPDARRLLVIAVTKIESFLYDQRTGRERPRQREAIVRRVEETYQHSLAYLKNQAKNCVIAVCPIETCGNLCLDHGWDPTATDGQHPMEHWDRLIDEYNVPHGRKGYRPADCELPLLAVLSFFLTDRLESAQQADRVVEELELIRAELELGVFLD